MSNLENNQELAYTTYISKPDSNDSDILVDYDPDQEPITKTDEELSITVD
jgi:hypothetical protein